MNIDIQSAPHSKEAESAVIGSVLLNQDAFHEAAKHIYSDDFYIIRNQWIWGAFDALVKEHTAIDIVTVSSNLDSQGKLSDIGGQSYLLELINDTPTSMHAEYYAKEVSNFASRRRALTAAQLLTKAAYDTKEEIQEFIPKYITDLLQIIKVENKTNHISVELSPLYDDIEYRSEHPQDVYGIPSGIQAIDDMTGGLFQKKEAMLISGMPGTGKSILALQIGFHAAKLGRPGVIYELEMGAIQTLRRTLSAYSGVNTRKMKSGRLEDGDWNKIVKSYEELSNYPLYFSDATSWTTASLRSDLVRLKQLHKIEWFIVDYIRLLKDRFDGKEPERIGVISSALHDICKDLDIGLLAIQSMTKEGMLQGGMTGVYGGSELQHCFDIMVILSKAEKRTLDNAEVMNLKFDKFRENDTDTDLVQLVKKPGFPAFGELLKTKSQFK
jgi:replicative DNA helicase